MAYQVTTVPPSIGALRHTAGGSWAVTGDSITPPGGHSYSDPSVAANPSGQMVVSFLDSFGPTAEAVRGTVAAGWGVNPTVGTLSSAVVSHGPLATISDSGNAVVGWSTSSAVQFSDFGSSGAFPAPATDQSIATDTPDNFALAGNGRGDAIAGWGTFDTSVMQNVVKAVVKTNTSATFGAPQIVSNRTVYSNNPVIGLDELGDGVVPYQLGATPNGVAAAIFDGAPPKFGTVSKPANVQAGKAAAFSATATDAFSAVTLRWSFGDGSAATSGGSVTAVRPRRRLHRDPHRDGRCRQLGLDDVLGHGCLRPATATAEVRRAKLVARPCPRPAPRCPAALQARQGHQPKKPKHRRLRKLIVKSSSPGRGAVRANGTKVAVTLVEVPKPKPKPKKHKK